MSWIVGFNSFMASQRLKHVETTKKTPQGCGATVGAAVASNSSNASGGCHSRNGHTIYPDLLGPWDLPMAQTQDGDASIYSLVRSVTA